MNLTNNYRPVKPRDFLSQTFSSYLYTNTNNQKNNPLSAYLSSNLSLSKQNTEFNTNNYVKKSLNLDITPTINNSLNSPKKEDNWHSIRHYSSFSSHNLNVNLDTNKSKKTLILDLDETLVHSAFSPFSRESDIILNINIEGENKTLYVLKRPHVDKFLQELSSLYEIIIFTASISQYANPLLNQLDKNNCIKYRLFREHCTFSNGIYIKDLKIFDRKMNNMIIIDNNPLSYDNNIDNGIPILSWYDNINDNELLKLLPLLKYMSTTNVQDVRTVINKIVDRRNNEIDYIAINRILPVDTNNNNNNNDNEYFNSTELTIENKYRKYTKSHEPKSRISSRNEDFDNNYKDYSSRSDIKIPLKYIPMSNSYDDNTLFSNKYNLNNNNLYNYNIREEEKKDNNTSLNINIDKMDPNGIRKSVFSPEEYNISYTKNLNYSYNTYKYNNNNYLDTKENNYYSTNTIKVQRKKEKENNEYINSYKTLYKSNTLSYKKEYDTILSTPNIDSRKKSLISLSNNDGKGDYIEGSKLTKKLSLVELTKKALHLTDDDDIYDNKSNINNEYENKGYKYNNYINKENDIMYNNNSYLERYKTNLDFNKGLYNRRNYKNFLEESKNMNEKTNDSLYNSKMLLLKKMGSTFNERFVNSDKLLYNNNMEINADDNNNKTKLLERINNEKINNFLNNNKLYQTGNNSYAQINHVKNYNRNNKDNYFNTIKKSLIVDKMSIKQDMFQGSLRKYISSNEIKSDKIYNNRYDSIDNYIKSYNNNFNNNSINYNSGKVLNLKSIKKINKKYDDYNNSHHLTRSSSFINLSSEIEKLLDKYTSKKDYNKENYNNNVNYNLDLNYKYDLKSVQSTFKENNNKYFNNSYNRMNILKY